MVGMERYVKVIFILYRPNLKSYKGNWVYATNEEGGMNTELEEKYKDLDESQ